ncbi:unnamed protein product, partial [Callosobruchus maculatus]
SACDPPALATSVRHGASSRESFTKCIRASFCYISCSTAGAQDLLSVIMMVYTGTEHRRRSSSTCERAPESKTRSDGEVPVVPAGERNSGGGGGGAGGGYHHHPATASPTATAAAAAAAATAAAGGWPPGLSLELDPVAAAWGRKLYP